MFTRVLLAVDGSEASQKAVDWAVNAYREMPKAEFTILYVHQPYVLPAPEVVGYIPYPFEAEQDVPAETAASQACERFPDKERVRCQTLFGNPAEVICEEAKTGGYDVIVLGSEGHGLVSSVLLGSVSAKVLHHSPCSVLIVR